MLIKQIYPSSNNLCSCFQINENSKIVIFWEYINLERSSNKIPEYELYRLFSGRLPGALAGLLEEGEGVVPRKYIMSEAIYYIKGIILQKISECSAE